MSNAKAVANTLMGDPSSDGIIYRAVRRAATEFVSCPTNRDLADMAGLNSVSQPPNILKRLEKRGALKIETSNRERRITIIATGAQTTVSNQFVALDPARYAERGRKISDALLRRAMAENDRCESTTDLPGKSQRTEIDEYRKRAALCTALKPLPIARPTPVLTVAPPTSADHRPPAPSREPCPRCATRGDLGCKHFAPCEKEHA